MAKALLFLSFPCFVGDRECLLLYKYLTYNSLQLLYKDITTLQLPIASYNFLHLITYSYILLEKERGFCGCDKLFMHFGLHRPILERENPYDTFLPTLTLGWCVE